MPDLKILVFSALIILFLFTEYMILRVNVLKIPMRIMINGTRGKSTTVRIIWDVLRASGYVVFAKTTGDKALLYYPDGRREPLRRHSPPRILENRSLILKWRRQSAQAVIMECMALKQENQYVLGNQIFNPTHVLITNITTDHLESMGPDGADIREAILNCIPEKSCKVYADNSLRPDLHDGICFTPAGANKIKISNHSFPNVPRKIIEENWDLISTLAKDLKLQNEKVDEFFCRRWSEINNKICRINEQKNYEFWDLFSVNDSETAALFIENILRRLSKTDQIEIIFNARADRPCRNRMFVKLIKSRMPTAKIWLIGSGRNLVKRWFKQTSGDFYVHITSSELLRKKIQDGFAHHTILLGMVNHSGVDELIRNIEELITT